MCIRDSYGTGSMVDLCKVIIDAFPDDFPGPSCPGKDGKHDGGQDNGGSHRHHGGH